MDYSFLTSQMRYSYSRIKTFDTCKYLFLLNYILNEKPKRENFFQQTGNVVHEILQQYLNGEIEKHQLAAGFSSKYLKEVTEKPMNRSLYNSTFTLLIEYLKNPDFGFAKKILGVEKEVDFKIDGYSFIGYIDLLCETDKGLAIVDHKSKELKPRRTGKKHQKQNKILDDYLIQLYLYSIPVKEQFGEYPKSLIFNCFKSGQIITEPFNYNDFVKAKQWARQKIEEINTEKEWKPTIDYFYCNYLCDMRDICEYKQMSKQKGG